MRRLLVAVLGVAVITVLVIMLITRTSSKPVPVTKQHKALHEYSDTSAVTIFTIQGKIVGDDQYRAIRITVGRDFRRVEVLDGYQNVVEKSQNFTNNQTAYDTFLRALELNGFTKQREVPVKDERGVCATGNRYIYELKDGSEEVQRTWSTSCATSQGTFGGQQATRQLFQAQITDFSKFIVGVRFQ